MSRQIISAQFFNRPTLLVAKELLGKFLVRAIGRRRTAGMITEVEAYVEPHDRASHASRGRTPRTEIMFGPPGHWYVYMIYGMHHCLNIVTEREGYPAAVLIRAAAVDKVAGPGRVCRYFKIDRRLNGKPANRASGLWIEDRGIEVKASGIRHGKRIGVEYAGKWKNKPWRFWIEPPFSLKFR